MALIQHLIGICNGSAKTASQFAYLSICDILEIIAMYYTAMVQVVGLVGKEPYLTSITV